MAHIHALEIGLASFHGNCGLDHSIYMSPNLCRWLEQELPDISSQYLLCYIITRNVTFTNK